MDLNRDAAEKLILSYINLLKINGFLVSTPEKLQYNFQVNVRRQGETVKVQTYFGKKGVKTVIQGNKDSGLYKTINQLICGEDLFPVEGSDFEEPKNYIGIDESGKGDYFGPLVIAGVFVEETSCTQLKQVGIRDSKLIPHNKIKILSDNIKRIIGDKYSIIIINPEKYNKLYSEIKNVNRLLAWGHSKVIENILEKYSVNEAISDKFADESLIKSVLQKKGKGISLHQFTRAERYSAVAAASILARNSLNRWFEEESDKLSFKLPKGASSAVEQAAGELTEKFGENILNKVAKLHFKTTNKIKVNR